MSLWSLVIMHLNVESRKSCWTQPPYEGNSFWLLVSGIMIDHDSSLKSVVFWLSSFFTTTDHHWGRGPNPSIHLFLHPITVTPPLEAKTQPGGRNPPFSNQTDSSQSLHTCPWTAPVHPEGLGPKMSTEMHPSKSNSSSPCIYLKAEVRFSFSWK